MFPSLGILQHYVEFDTHTIVMLENLFVGGSFNGFISHLVHRQATLFTSSSEFSLLFVVQSIALAFLGYRALIALPLVICF
jgi:hypothetical protein